ncbi:MAG: hypothetical protein ICV74_06465, partial [Thermoleophilia bacterium]|nr:hypothetical protein [Thermoleophilia bacterium]
ERSLHRQLRLFGSGSWKLFGIGPYAALLGRPVGPLTPGAPQGGSAVVSAVTSELLRKLPRRSFVVPSPVTGTLAGVAPRTGLALALNGRIAALCRSYRTRDGVVRFSALAAPAAFRPGANEAVLYALAGPRSAPQLTELQTELSQ